MGHTALFIQRQGRKLRALAYLFDYDNWNAEDMTMLSEHITAGGVRSMCWVGEPEPTLFLVRADGQLLAISYEKSENVAGWCRYVTDGEFESLAAIPGDNGDELWALVKRTRAGQGFDLDITASGGSLSDGMAGDSLILPQGMVFQAGWLAKGSEDGRERWYRYQGTQVMDASASDIAVAFSDSPAGNELESIHDQNGNLDSSNWLALDDPWEVVRSVERLDPQFQGQDSTAAFFLDAGLTYQGEATDSVSGLDHIRGRTVHILGDGAVQPPVVVDSLGMAALAEAAETVHAGLSYTSTLKTMPLDRGSPNGTAQGKRKRIHRLRLQLMDTMAVNGMVVGPDLTTLDQVDFRLETDSIDQAPSLFTGILDAGKFPGGTEREGSIVFRQSDPLPCTLVAIYPQMLTESS